MRSISVLATERPPRRLLGAALLALSVAALTGCGDSGGDGDEPGAEPVGQELGGSVAPLVQCSDWNGATQAERIATIEDVRSQVNLEDGGIEAPALTDSEAIKIFDNGCGGPGSDGFRLYLLYARAIAFKPLADIASGEVTAPEAAP